MFRGPGAHTPCASSSVICLLIIAWCLDPVLLRNWKRRNHGVLLCTRLGNDDHRSPRFPVVVTRILRCHKASHVCWKVLLRPALRRWGRTCRDRSFGALTGGSSRGAGSLGLPCGPIGWPACGATCSTQESRLMCCVKAESYHPET